jgi:hypothetical protein
MSQTDRLLEEISRKMDKLLRLQALEAVKGIALEQGKIELLDSLGFRPIEIAALLNKTPENISVQLGLLRKKKADKKAKAPEQIHAPSGQKGSADDLVNPSKIEGNQK